MAINYVHVYRQMQKRNVAIKYDVEAECPERTELTIGRFEVRGCTKTEAPAVLIHWLMRNRPQSMMVAEIK